MKWMGLALSVLAAAPLAGQGYGQSVAVGDGQVIVGESLNTMAPGYVYVYEKDTLGAWTEVQRLEASNSASGDHFGRSLALTGNHLLVGSTTLETVYVFEKDRGGTWSETQALQVRGSVEGDYIGRMAAVDGDDVLMAAWAYSENRGAVYVFHRDASTGLWSESGRLTGSDAQPNDLFGMSVAIEGDVAMIGAPEKDGSTGAVYAFGLDETGVWTERVKLTGAGTGPNSRFRPVGRPERRSRPHRRLHSRAGSRHRLRLRLQPGLGRVGGGSHAEAVRWGSTWHTVRCRRLHR